MTKAIFILAVFVGGLTSGDIKNAAESLATRQENVQQSTHHLFFGQNRVAVIQETWDPARRILTRVSRLLQSEDGASTVTIILDAAGFVVEADYMRESDRGGRNVSLQQGEQGLMHFRDKTTGMEKALSEHPLVLLDALHYVRPVSSPKEVMVADLSTGEAMLATLDSVGKKIVLKTEQGLELASTGSDPVVRNGPGAFVETNDVRFMTVASYPVVPDALATRASWGRHVVLKGLKISPDRLAVVGPGQNASYTSEGHWVIHWDRQYADKKQPTPSARQPAVFLESDSTKVKAFAQRYGGEDVWQDAIQISRAIHDMLDTRGGGGPPSAVSTLSRKAGDCDDATALLVAALRARGHAARPIVGYELTEKRWVPHAWAEVWTGNEWTPVDALRPGIGPFPTHLRLFFGLGSPLTMGRVLGTWQPEVWTPRADLPATRTAP